MANLIANLVEIKGPDAGNLASRLLPVARTGLQVRDLDQGVVARLVTSGSIPDEIIDGIEESGHNVMLLFVDEGNGFGGRYTTGNGTEDVEFDDNFAQTEGDPEVFQQLVDRLALVPLDHDDEEED